MRKLILLSILSVILSSCMGQDEGERMTPVTTAHSIVSTNVLTTSQPLSAFVRRIFQDSKDNLWLGTNGDGVIKYSKGSIDYNSHQNGFRGLAVRAIIEDAESNIWFATERGITKYDGQTFTNFDKKDGLLGDNVWSLTIDSNNVMWIGTLNGAYKYDGVSFVRFDLPEVEPNNYRGLTSSSAVHCIIEDRSGKMWFGTDGGIAIYNGEKLENLSEKDGLANNSVNDIHQDRNGDFWLATHHGGISKYDGKSFTNYTLDATIQGEEVWSIFEDKDGGIWFPAENFGVYHFDGNKFINYNESHGLSTNAIQDIYEDRQGRFWLGGYKGLFKLEDNTIRSITEKELVKL